jgi:peptidoglycan hydrolase CwlO-like protein
MGLFGKRREKVVDLSAGYRMPTRKVQASPKDDSSNSDVNFLGDMANSSSSMSTSNDISWDNESSSSQTVGEYSEKKQKLTKRLLSMTDKIEDLSNQIYHLKQRIELLEKKMKISFD